MQNLWLSFCFCFIFIEIQLIYNAMLALGSQQTDSVVFFSFFSTTGKDIEYSSRAIQEVLVNDLFYIQWSIYLIPDSI